MRHSTMARLAGLALGSVTLMAADCTRPTPNPAAIVVAPGAVGGPGGTFARRNEAGVLVNVDVAVSPYAIVVDPRTPPGDRTLIATFTNRGPGNERMYHFKPAPDATYQLYAENRLDPSTNTTAYTFVEVANNGTTSIVKSGGFFDCADGHTSARPDAGFKRCGVRPVTMNTINRSSMVSNPLLTRLLKVFGLLQTGMDSTGGGAGDPAWVACTDGCCTTSTAE